MLQGPLNVHLLKCHKERHIRVSNTRSYCQLSRYTKTDWIMDMAWTCKVLVILVIAPAIAEKLSLPPAKFLKDFALKYQRSSIVMNIPKKISRNQVIKRFNGRLRFVDKREHDYKFC